MQKTALLILAAGRSSRMMGRDKCFALIDGAPLLWVMTTRALATGAKTYVTLPSANHPRARLLDGTKATAVIVDNPTQGLSASLRAGIAALPEEISGAMIIPADMPDLQISDFKRLLSLFDDACTANILRATTKDGTPGHPVILPKWLFPEIALLTGDRGAGSLLNSYRDQTTLVALCDQRAICDLDTPEEWDEWNKRRQDQ